MKQIWLNGQQQGYEREGTALERVEVCSCKQNSFITGCPTITSSFTLFFKQDFCTGPECQGLKGVMMVMKGNGQFFFSLQASWTAGFVHESSPVIGIILTSSQSSDQVGQIESLHCCEARYALLLLLVLLWVLCCLPLFLLQYCSVWSPGAPEWKGF